MNWIRQPTKQKTLKSVESALAQDHRKLRQELSAVYRSTTWRAADGARRLLDKIRSPKKHKNPAGNYLFIVGDSYGDGGTTITVTGDDGAVWASHASSSGSTYSDAFTTPADAPSTWPVTPVWTTKWLKEELYDYGYGFIDNNIFYW